MRVRCTLYALVSSAVISSCSTQLRFIPSADAARAAQPRGPAQVDVLTTGAPARAHAELGIIEAQRTDGADDEAEVIASMRQYAAERGCDALVILGSDAQTYRGACLIYTAPPLMQPPPIAASPGAPNACIPNAPQLCYGPGGCRGNQLCSGDGKAFTPCDCGASQ